MADAALPVLTDERLQQILAHPGFPVGAKLLAAEVVALRAELTSLRRTLSASDAACEVCGAYKAPGSPSGIVIVPGT